MLLLQIAGHSCASVKLLLLLLLLVVVVAGGDRCETAGPARPAPEKASEIGLCARSFDPSCLRRPATTTTDGWMDGR